MRNWMAPLLLLILCNPLECINIDCDPIQLDGINWDGSSKGADINVYVLSPYDAPNKSVKGYLQPPSKGEKSPFVEEVEAYYNKQMTR